MDWGWEIEIGDIGIAESLLIIPLLLTNTIRGVRVARRALTRKGAQKMPISTLFDWLESRIIRKSGPDMASDICQITVKLEGVYLTI